MCTQTVWDGRTGVSHPTYVHFIHLSVCLRGSLMQMRVCHRAALDSGVPSPGSGAHCQHLSLAEPPAESLHPRAVKYTAASSVCHDYLLALRFALLGDTLWVSPPNFWLLFFPGWHLLLWEPPASFSTLRCWLLPLSQIIFKTALQYCHTFYCHCF